jgi:hypothetical protein
VLVIDRHVGGIARLRAGRDHDVRRLDPADLAVDAADLHHVRGHEARAAVPALDAVALELIADELLVRRDHLVEPGHQARQLEVVRRPEVERTCRAAAHEAERDRGLAQRLRRDRAAVDAGTTGEGHLLDDERLRVRLRRLDRRLLTGRTAADHQHVDLHDSSFTV